MARKNSKKNAVKLLALAAGGIAAAMLQDQAKAADGGTYTYIGTGTSGFYTPADWQSSSQPNSTDVLDNLTFTGIAGVNPTAQNYSTNSALGTQSNFINGVNSITFAAGTSSYTILGPTAGVLALNAGGAITNNSTKSQTITERLSLNGNATINAASSGSLIFTDGFNTGAAASNSLVFASAAAGTASIGAGGYGGITGTGGVTLNSGSLTFAASASLSAGFISIGGGTLTASTGGIVDNTGLSLSGGTLAMNTNTVSGAGSVIDAGGTASGVAVYSNGGGITVTSGSFTAGSISGSGGLTVGGGTVIAGADTGGISNGNVTVSGGILSIGAGGITSAGAVSLGGTGTLDFTNLLNSNAFFNAASSTAGLVITGGTLNLAGGFNVAANTSSALNANGWAIIGAGPVNIGSGSTLSLGQLSSSSTTPISLTSSIVMASGSTINVSNAAVTGTTSGAVLAPVTVGNNITIASGTAGINLTSTGSSTTGLQLNNTTLGSGGTLDFSNSSSGFFKASAVTLGANSLLQTFGSSPDGVTISTLSYSSGAQVVTSGITTIGAMVGTGNGVYVSSGTTTFTALTNTFVGNLTVASGATLNGSGSGQSSGYGNTNNAITLAGGTLQQTGVGSVPYAIVIASSSTILGGGGMNLTGPLNGLGANGSAGDTLTVNLNPASGGGTATYKASTSQTFAGTIDVVGNNGTPSNDFDLESLTPIQANIILDSTGAGRGLASEIYNNQFAGTNSVQINSGGWQLDGTSQSIGTLILNQTAVSPVPSLINPVNPGAGPVTTQSVLSIATLADLRGGSVVVIGNTGTSGQLVLSGSSTAQLVKTTGLEVSITSGLAGFGGGLTVLNGLLLLGVTDGLTNTYNGDVSLFGGVLSIASGSDTTATLNQGGTALTYSLGGGTLVNGGTMSHLILATNAATSSIASGTFTGGITVQQGSTLNAAVGVVYATGSSLLIGDTAAASNAVLSVTGAAPLLTANGRIGGFGTVSSSNSATFVVSIAPGATLSPGNVSAGVFSISGGLVIATGSNLSYVLGTAGSSTSPGLGSDVLVSNKLTFSGTAAHTVDLNLASISAGTFQLFTYGTSSGLAAGNITSDFTVTGNGGDTATITDIGGAGAGSIDLTLTGTPSAGVTVSLTNSTGGTSSRIFGGTALGVKGGVSVASGGNFNYALSSNPGSSITFTSGSTGSVAAASSNPYAGSIASGTLAANGTAQNVYSIATDSGQAITATSGPLSVTVYQHGTGVVNGSATTPQTISLGYATQFSGATSVLGSSFTVGTQANSSAAGLVWSVSNAGSANILGGATNQSGVVAPGGSTPYSVALNANTSSIGAQTLTQTITYGDDPTVIGAQSSLSATTVNVTGTVYAIAENTSLGSPLIAPNRSNVGTIVLTGSPTEGYFGRTDINGSLGAQRGQVTISTASVGGDFPSPHYFLFQYEADGALAHSGVNSPPGSTSLAALESDLSTYGYTYEDYTGANDVGSTGTAYTDMTAALTASPQYDLAIAFDPPTGDQSLDFDFGNYNLTAYNVAAVPEPGSLALLGLGAIGLLGRRRSRRTRKAEAVAV